MADAGTIVGAVGITAAISTIVFGGAGVFGVVRFFNDMRRQSREERDAWLQELRLVRQEERKEYEAFFITYDNSIAVLKSQYDTETDAAKKATLKEHLDQVAEEYRVQLQEYREKSVVNTLARPGAVPLERSDPSKDRRDQLSQSLEGSKRLNPALLTPDDYSARGNAAYELGNYEDALAHYSRVLQLRPDDPVTLYNRGAALYNLQRYDEAVSAYNRALEIQPDDPFTLYNRGTALVKRQRYREALASFDRAREIMPGDYQILYNRACALSLMGSLTEALDALKEAILASDECRLKAREDEDHDFDNLRSDPKLGTEFERLVAEPEE